MVCPIFDSLEYLKTQRLTEDYPSFAQEDFNQAKQFLLSYKGNEATFQAYRREVERLLQWTWHKAHKSIKELKRTDIETYIAFCQNPPHTWIGLKKVSRFLEKENQRRPHPEWRPFVATVSKAESRRGISADAKQYTLSHKSLREIFGIVSSFYVFLIQEDYVGANPVQQLRQKNQYFKRTQGKAKVRRLSELQWHYVIDTAEKMAKTEARHERTLFIVTALYALYLRISELAATGRWTPTMGDFFCDTDGLWWFTTVGKGNKERQIAVSDAMLQALKRYRISLGLLPLPTPRETQPLLSKQLGKGPITSTSQIRIIVQNCFDQARIKLLQDGFQREAEALLEATVHWLRHTGISEDVKHRPREHVRDDAGHSSSITTDRYIDIELRERHASSKKKLIKPL